MIRHFSHIFLTEGRTFTASTFPVEPAGRTRPRIGGSGGPDDGSSTAPHRRLL